MVRIASVLLLIIAFAHDGLSQSFYSVRRDRSLILILGTGTSSYFGELKNDGDFIDAKPNLNVGFQYFFLPRVAGRLEATWFQLSGDDSKADDSGRKKRNLSFVSNNFEIAIGANIYLVPQANRYYQRPLFNPYVFVGFGLAYINPIAKLDGERHALQPLQTEGVKYSKIQPVIPFGLGARLKMGPFFNLVVEGGYRKTFTDYLDDVSTVHPDKTGWDPVRTALSDRSPELGLAPYEVGTKRGNPDSKDGYFLANIKIEYYMATPFSIGDPSRRLYKQKRKAYHR
jgi:hypothetical protein